MVDNLYIAQNSTSAFVTNVQTETNSEANQQSKTSFIKTFIEVSYPNIEIV